MTNQTQADISFDQMLGRKLRLLRIERGMTQKGLAKKLDVSFQQVQKYEAGVNRMSAARLFALSRIFGITMQHWVIQESDAFYGEAQGNAPQEAPPPVTDRRGVHLMHYFSKIEDETLKTLLFAFTRRLAGREREGE